MAQRRAVEDDGCLDRGGPLSDAEFLPYGRQDISDDDIRAVVEALRSPLITQGPLIEQFESAVADYLGACYVVAFANGTAALHGATHAADLGQGDAVLTTPLSFAASANCVLYQQAVPQFIDISPSTWNLDIELVMRKIEATTKAIVAVSFAGLPVDLEPLSPIRDRVVVIEDASHALGARRAGVPVGGPGHADMTTFSLHPVKAMTTGEGGLVSTENADFAERLRLFRTHGITNDSVASSEHDGPWYQEMRELGFNYRITDFQCALGLSQLSRLDEFTKSRNRIAAWYRQLLHDEPRIALPPAASPDDRHGYHLFVILVRGGPPVRRSVFDAMRKASIGVQVHYIPIYKHPYYRDVVGSPQETCPVAESYYGGAISLPIFPSMTERDVERVVSELKRALP